MGHGRNAISMPLCVLSSFPEALGIWSWGGQGSLWTQYAHTMPSAPEPMSPPEQADQHEEEGLVPLSPLRCTQQSGCPRTQGPARPGRYEWLQGLWRGRQWQKAGLRRAERNVGTSSTFQKPWPPPCSCTGLRPSGDRADPVMQTAGEMCIHSRQEVTLRWPVQLRFQCVKEGAGLVWCLPTCHR